ncbi:MAG: hypothetical protein RMI45_08815 [Ignisphaera sp.]|nr:hypothetical protein [Ignisphaera sp.]
MLMRKITVLLVVIILLIGILSMTMPNILCYAGVHCDEKTTTTTSITKTVTKTLCVIVRTSITTTTEWFTTTIGDE